MCNNKRFFIALIITSVVGSSILYAADSDQMAAKQILKMIRVIVQISVATIFLLQIKGRFETFGLAAVMFLASYVITISDGMYRLYKTYTGYSHKQSLQEQVVSLKTLLEEKIEQIDQIESAVNEKESLD